MAPDEGLGKPEFAPQRAHFVLEKFAQGFDQRHVHALW